ncbi:DUF1761 domain-containing protein [uncultured Maricaulis sp.]|uniref:DUF1761 domain-containing protein n=1 Tax=uncultured Maricaulis sp. TaxID=174710 RepID=UPI0030DB51AA|tara:strand:+ start:12270 stop:12713 length:444 start_codon:yes stop_codon:yes gene_type:complete
MPRIFGLNIIAVLVSAIALYFVGFLFYGLFFADLWIGLQGFTEAQILEADEHMALGMVHGFLISLVTATFIGLALKRFGADGMMPAIQGAVLLWAGFALTTLAYGFVYAMQPFMLFVLDGSHLLVGFIVVAAVQTALDGVGVKSEYA